MGIKQKSSSRQPCAISGVEVRREVDSPTIGGEDSGI